MPYVLDQYNKVDGQDDNIFMELVTDSTKPSTRKNPGDMGVTGDNILSFWDECIYLTNSVFNVDVSYYFHGKIQRMKEDDQEFDIKLCYYQPEKQEDKLVTQYITTINVEKGTADYWADIEFIFTPLRNFDCILFELKRTNKDYRDSARIPVIAYEELSIIKDIIGPKIGEEVRLIKIGVQSHPGLLMCINNEGILTNGTGIYELKNGIMTINFFSVISSAKEQTTDMKDWIDNITTEVLALDESGKTGEDYYNEKTRIMDDTETGRVKSCFFTKEKTRTIDRFTLDYLYVKD